MNDNIIENQPCEIEPQSIESAKPQPSWLSRWVNEICESLLRNLQKQSEPKVRVTAGRDGVPQWKAYDPVSKRSIVTSNELEVRMWLERLPRHW